ncbi:kinase-like domain-containing protein [Aspergillus granulosus]|uniref:Kinase-like domain-containing protein n=1 Tax=Aspergillus granulosus TaxID=176169 RepID=A0ABR4HAD9_9EURO
MLEDHNKHTWADHVRFLTMQQQSFYENNIPIAISHLRNDRQIPTLHQYFDGGQCRVFKVTFTDGESWAIRVPLFVRHASQNIVIQLLESEAQVLQELELKGFSWAPRLRGCSLTFNNAVRYPFLALTWIPGSQLSWSDGFPTQPLRNKTLDQIAMMHTSLIECSKEARGSSLKHFTRIIQNKTRRVREGLLPEIREQDCSKQIEILSDVLLLELDEAPFAIAHGDLSPQNILIDAHHNVTGIIDWGFSSRVPFQQAACFPRFLQLQNIDMSPSSTLLKDRETYITSIRCQTALAVSSMMIQVLSSENVDFQHCFLESIISKGMHRRLARNGWRVSSYG